jgi:tetratricopeptide (TPR) repeat protein
VEYPYEQLDDKQFQTLCQSLLAAMWPDLQAFPLGEADGGRDATRRLHDTEQSPGFVVYQVKFTREPHAVRDTVRWLRDVIDRERRSIDRLAAEGASHYEIITNVRGSGAGAVGEMDRLQAILDELPMARATCRWRHDLDVQLTAHPHVRLSFPELMSGRDVISLSRWPSADPIAGAGSMVRTVPRALPQAPLRFVNRSRELAAVDTVWYRDGSDPKVVLISGMHGVGKSAFGRAWANRNRMAFPDGDLYGDFSRQRRGGLVDVSEVLAEVLRNLGVAASEILPTLRERRQQFLQFTAERKMLILLDDVDQPAHVNLFIPSGNESMVIATTSQTLDEVIAGGAKVVRILPFANPTSRDLLAEFVTDGRLEAEPAATDELIALCGGLPLAVCVCGGRLAARPTRTVRWLVDRIRVAPNRLTVLSGSGEFALGQVLDLAYEELDPRTAAVYRRLSLLPGVDFGVAAASTVVGGALEDAADRLESLEGSHLLESRMPERYCFHDLTRHHALSRRLADDDGSACDEALIRLVDWYYAATRSVDHTVTPERLRLTDGLEVQAANIPTFSSPGDAFGWFALERTNVVAVARAASDRELDERVWQFAEAMWIPCTSHRYFAELVEVHILGIESSIRLGDPAAEARLRSQLGRTYAELRDSERAAEQIALAKASVARTGHISLTASVVEFGGVCDLRLGRPARALAAFAEARDGFVAAGDERGEALQDYLAGRALLALERPHEALDSLDRALSMFMRRGDRMSASKAMLRRGEALVALGSAPRAKRAFSATVELARESGLPLEQAQAYEQLAAVALPARPSIARRNYEHAHRIYLELGHPRADLLLTLLEQPA